MNEQRLRKAVSDVSSEIDRYRAMETISLTDEIMQTECECCGLKEDCTLQYIEKVKSTYSGNWLCGLCCEAVRERLDRAPTMAMPEAVSSHREFCQIFNSTTRMNPKLSLTSAMRDIVRRSSEIRNGKNFSKLARTSSCAPRIDLNY